MKLDEVLEQFSHIRLATKKDSEALKKVFRSSPMNSKGLNLSYERSPDFFKFLSYQGETAFVVCMELDGEMVGVSSISVREGYVSGQKKRIGYLGDLRIQSKKISKELSIQWKTAIEKVVRNASIIDEMRCSHLITVIMSNNKKAIDSLVNNKKNPFHYQRVAQYDMVNLVHRFFPKVSFAKRASLLDQDRLLNFFDQQNKTVEYGYTKEFVENAFKTYNNFSIENFIYVENNNEIIACCALWNPSPVKKIIVKQLPISLKAFAKISSPFTRSLRTNKEMRVQYLAFLTIKSNPHYCMEQFINLFGREGGFKRYDMLAFSDYSSAQIYEKKRTDIVNRTPLSMFQVVSKEELSLIVPVDGRSGFEMSLV